MNEEKVFLKYKNRPLVRCGNTIFYGDISEDYVVKIDIKNEKSMNKVKISDSLSVKMISSSSAIRGRMLRAAKTSDKNGLFEALDIGSVWLERASRKDLKFKNKLKA